MTKIEMRKEIETGKATKLAEITRKDIYGDNELVTTTVYIATDNSIWEYEYHNDFLSIVTPITLDVLELWNSFNLTVEMNKFHKNAYENAISILKERGLYA